MAKMYTLDIHYKQGDDLSGHMGQAKTTQGALKLWADQLEAGVTAIRRLAEIFEGKELYIDADTHCISIISSDKKALKQAVKEGLLTEEDF